MKYMPPSNFHRRIQKEAVRLFKEQDLTLTEVSCNLVIRSRLIRVGF